MIVHSITSRILAHGSYIFYYSVQSTEPATISIHSCTATPTAIPTPKATPTPSATPTPTHIPPATQILMDSATATHCDIVFVFDNYIMRGTNLSNTLLTAKYTDYFKDIQTFYRSKFNIDMRISDIYLESNSSFSDSLDASEVLEAFRSAIIGGVFPRLPSSACIYHLLTGRDIDGIGGLAWVRLFSPLFLS